MKKKLPFVGVIRWRAVFGYGDEENAALEQTVFHKNTLETNTRVHFIIQSTIFTKKSLVVIFVFCYPMITVV